VIRWEQKKLLKSRAVRKKQFLNGAEREKFLMPIRIKRGALGIYQKMQSHQPV